MHINDISENQFVLGFEKNEHKRHFESAFQNADSIFAKWAWTHPNLSVWSKKLCKCCIINPLSVVCTRWLYNSLCRPKNGNEDSTDKKFFCHPNILLYPVFFLSCNCPRPPPKKKLLFFLLQKHNYLMCLPWYNFFTLAGDILQLNELSVFLTLSGLTCVWRKAKAFYI